VNQGTFSKSKLLHSLSIKLEDRYINHWKKLLSLNEGTTELILENNSLRHSSNLEHFKMKLFHPLVLYYREDIFSFPLEV
jgi:hypothetical protein